LQLVCGCKRVCVRERVRVCVAPLHRWITVLATYNLQLATCVCCPSECVPHAAWRMGKLHYGPDDGPDDGPIA
jgi:hypothetical protein